MARNVIDPTTGKLVELARKNELTMQLKKSIKFNPYYFDLNFVLLATGNLVKFSRCFHLVAQWAKACKIH